MGLGLEEAFRLSVGDPNAVSSAIASRKSVRDRNNSERLSAMRSGLMTMAIGDASAVSVMAEMENRADAAANALSQENGAAAKKNLSPIPHGDSDFDQSQQQDMSF